MAYLVFKDGTKFEGEAFGAWPKDLTSVAAHEVVFNTSMSGYQEMVTDLSYAGQILVLLNLKLEIMGGTMKKMKQIKLGCRA